MRVGDVYRMRGLLKGGASMDDVYHAFRNKYSPEEIDQFIKPPKKRTRAKKEVENVLGSPDM